MRAGVVGGGRSGTSRGRLVLSAPHEVGAHDRRRDVFPHGPCDRDVGDDAGDTAPRDMTELTPAKPDDLSDGAAGVIGDAGRLPAYLAGAGVAAPLFWPSRFRRARGGFGMMATSPLRVRSVPDRYVESVAAIAWNTSARSVT